MIRKFSLPKVMFSTIFSLAKGIRSKTGAAHPVKTFSQRNHGWWNNHAVNHGSQPAYYCMISRKSHHLAHLITREHTCNGVPLKIHAPKMIPVAWITLAVLFYKVRMSGHLSKSNNFCEFIVWHIDGLVQDCSICVDKALEIPQPCSESYVLYPWHCRAAW